MKHEPVDPAYLLRLNRLARQIDAYLNPHDPPKVGFVLCLFEFGPPHPGQRFNYISNADGQDMLATFKDILARLEGRYSNPGNA